MKNALFALVTLVAIALGVIAFSAGRGTSSAAVSPTDLVVGQTYRVADFRSCQMDDGALAYEWHFGGMDRSRRNQLTPYLDGRGRRILRPTAAIPFGMMRLVRVNEADPTLEGFSYGTYRWEGLVVEYNGSVEPQAVVKVCGPAR